MGLKGKDSVFPKNLKKGAKGRAATYAVMYQALEGAKERLGLDRTLTWHSFRIGSATGGTVFRVRRSVLKGAGKWRSSCVDLYCREEEPGVVLSIALVDLLNSSLWGILLLGPTGLPEILTNLKRTIMDICYIIRL